MVISVIVAAVAVTICALVAIAYMLRWLPQQPAASAPGVALLPGETVVTPEPPPATAAPPSPAPAAAPPTAPAPTTPSYSRPAPEVTPVPRDPAPEPAARKPVARPAPATNPIPAPKAPVYARASPERTPCVQCGTVTATTAYSDSWEVRVRFEDGTTRTIRHRSPPGFGIGQRVRLEDGRLVRDD